MNGRELKQSDFNRLNQTVISLSQQAKEKIATVEIDTFDSATAQQTLLAKLDGHLVKRNRVSNRILRMIQNRSAAAENKDTATDTNTDTSDTANTCEDNEKEKNLFTKNEAGQQEYQIFKMIKQAILSIQNEKTALLALRTLKQLMGKRGKEVRLGDEVIDLLQGILTKQAQAKDLARAKLLEQFNHELLSLINSAIRRIYADSTQDISELILARKAEIEASSNIPAHPGREPQMQDFADYNVDNANDYRHAPSSQEGAYLQEQGEWFRANQRYTKAIFTHEQCVKQTQKILAKAKFPSNRIKLADILANQLIVVEQHKLNDKLKIYAARLAVALPEDVATRHIADITEKMQAHAKLFFEVKLGLGEVNHGGAAAAPSAPPQAAVYSDAQLVNRFGMRAAAPAAAAAAAAAEPSAPSYQSR